MWTLFCILLVCKNLNKLLINRTNRNSIADFKEMTDRNDSVNKPSFTSSRIFETEGSNKEKECYCCTPDSSTGDIRPTEEKSTIQD